MFVDSPKNAVAEADTNDERLYVWIQNNLFAGSPKLQQLQSLEAVIAGGGQSSFTATRSAIASRRFIQDGAGLLVAANLEKVVEQTRAERMKDKDAAKNESALAVGHSECEVLRVQPERLEWKDEYRSVTLVQRHATRHSRVASFAWTNGIALEYISPEANVVAGFVVKDPHRWLTIFSACWKQCRPVRKTIDQQASARGLNIRNDIAMPLGGEFAFAIDGPAPADTVVEAGV